MSLFSLFSKCQIQAANPRLHLAVSFLADQRAADVVHCRGHFGDCSGRHRRLPALSPCCGGLWPPHCAGLLRLLAAGRKKLRGAQKPALTLIGKWPHRMSCCL